MKRNSRTFIVYLCFFLSGISALFYEVAWLSRIQLVMGHSIYALTTVICAYLSGLALGALFFPRLQKTGLSCFWIYILAEFLIGLYGLGFNATLSSIQAPYYSLVSQFEFSPTTLSLIQFFFCGALVVIPTMLMGTTLPLLADYLFQGKYEVSCRISTLYGINTLGACVGSFAAGFIILPWLGYNKTMLLAAGINFLLVTFALFSTPDEEKPSIKEIRKGLGRVFKASHKEPAESLREYSPGKNWTVYIVLFISGAVSMLSQILWNRLAGLSFGSSVYIFPLVTTLVLLGIAGGSFIFRRFSDSPEKVENILIFLPLLSGAVFYTGTYFFTQSPISVFYWHQVISPGFKLYTLLQFARICACLLPSAILLGMIFPASVSMVTRDAQNPSKVLGIGYALNISGLVAGAITGAFVLLPLFGLESIGKVVFALLIVSTSILILNMKKQTALVICSVLLGGIFLFTIPAYDWKLLTAGLFYNRKPVKPEQKLRLQGYTDITGYANWHTNRLLALEDDPYMTLSIHESLHEPDIRHFRINGKVDGSNAGDLEAFRLVALFPLLARPEAKSVLTIGLGIGSTASETLKYPNLKKTTVVEISEAMVRYAQKYFFDINGKMWQDPRVHIFHRDGREYLSHTTEKFDAIISQPSNPWLDGTSNLFTREYFQLLSQRLNKNGVACIWFHSYNMDCRSVSSVFGATVAVFPSVLVFQSGNNYYLLAKNEPGGIRLNRLPNSTPLLEKELFELVELKEKGKTDLYQDLIRNTIVADQEDIKRFTSLINTDDNQFLQYATGRIFWQKVYCDDLTDVLQSDVTQQKYLRGQLSF